MNFLYGHALWGKKVNEQISNSKIDFFRFLKNMLWGRYGGALGEFLGDLG